MSARRCLVPKHRFNFRVSTQLNSLDFLIFTALIKDVGDKLETQRIPVIKNIVHSYRFLLASNKSMYSEDQTSGSSQKTSQLILHTSGISHVVIADIAGFYPRIYTHRTLSYAITSFCSTCAAITIKSDRILA